MVSVMLGILVTLLIADSSAADMMFISPGAQQANSEMEFPLVSDNELVPEIPGRKENPNQEININKPSPGGDMDSNPENMVTMQPPSIDCGTVVDTAMAENGTIKSPGYPENYPAYLNCKWEIKATPGKKIVASFSEFDVTASTDCSSDYVIISTGEKSNRYCGKAAPAHIESESEVLTIEFHTNQGDSCRGFSLDYTVVTKQVTCGAVTSDLQFEFRSPMYPAPLENKTSQCDLTVSHDCDKPICQLRLDLMDFRLAPPTAGDCNSDQFIIRANEPLPVLCGNNSKQHMYVDVRGRKETNLNILSMPVLPKPVGVHNETDADRVIIEWLHEVDPNRAWNILVTQIPCMCEDSSLPEPPAPTGCLQYHKEISGVISSFNYHGTIRNYEPCWNGTESDCGEHVHTGHLNNLDYTVCIKSKAGYCGVVYDQVAPDSFQLTGLKDENIASPWNGEKYCYDDYVYVPRGAHIDDLGSQYTVERYCGQAFGNVLTGPVMSFSKPFLMRMKTDNQEPHGGVAINNRGFEVKYTQIPCSVGPQGVKAFA